VVTFKVVNTDIVVDEEIDITRLRWQLLLKQLN
jgi:hypothetical protein